MARELWRIEVLVNDLIGFGLYLSFIIVVALSMLLLKAYIAVPFEIFRKMLHIMITLSIFPLITLFSTWYMAVLAAALFALMVYPLLALVENSSLYKRIAVERQGGEFKSSLIIVQASISLLIFVFWGVLGTEWKYIAVVAVMAWGFGDAAAALVGKKFGRRRIFHPLIEGTKTMEGTHAMYIAAGLAIFFTLLVYAGQPWYVSLAVALLVAPVCAVVELFSNRGMDTLTVPISTGLAILPLMLLLSYLGA
jgi:phytol kinase